MKIKAENINKNRIGWHLLFWVAYLIFFTFQAGYSNSNYLNTFIIYCLYLPIIIIATYFTIYFIIPRYLLTKEYKQFFAWLLISVIVFTSLHRGVVFFIISPLLYSKELNANIQNNGFFYPLALIGQFISMYSVVTAAAFIKILKKWFQDDRRNRQLAQEKLEAEIKFLKSQIHPHFLFNTLNNLYALTLKKSDLAPEMVLKLSALLDYMLYECNADRLPVTKEINLLKDYIALEKLRHGERLNVDFSLTGQTEGVMISPLILFPFVENSFKHGVNNELNNSFIDIKLKIENGLLNLKVINSKNNLAAKTKSKTEEGIGLKNIKRRLDLLYPGHVLVTEDEKEIFSVDMTINL